jgi:hypothetical protein
MHRKVIEQAIFDQQYPFNQSHATDSLHGTSALTEAIDRTLQTNPDVVEVSKRLTSENLTSIMSGVAMLSGETIMR